MVDVIGAGFGRTGTASLKAALEHLGLGPAITCSRSSRTPRTPSPVGASHFAVALSVVGVDDGFGDPAVLVLGYR